LAADVDEDALDGAADERPGHLACVVVGDGLGNRASDDQAAAEPKLAGLGPDRILTETLVPDVPDIGTERALDGLVSPSSSKLAEKPTWPLGSGASASTTCSSAPIPL
jgi:hypothetical protein